MTLYFDLDILLYSNLRVHGNPPPMFGGLRVCARSCDATIDRILEELRPDDFELVTSGPGNFRYTIYPQYKANRPPKPPNLPDLRQYYLKYWGATITSGEEADDYIASNYQENDIIATTDKDFRQLGGWIYNLSTGFTYKGEGLSYFFMQLLTGDRIDNIPGVRNPAKSHYKNPPNFSEETAREVLGGKSLGEMKELVQNLYKDDEAFHRNATCLWLKRGPDDSYLNHI